LGLLGSKTLDQLRQWGGIRNKLIFAIILFLTTPVMGYKILVEMKHFLQQGQENALSMAAQAVATVLHNNEALFNPETGIPHALSNEQDLYAHELIETPDLDDPGFEEWIPILSRAVEYGQNHILQGGKQYNTGDLSYQHLLGVSDDKRHIYALFRVTDNQTLFRRSKGLRVDSGDHLRIFLQHQNQSPQNYLATAYRAGLMSIYQMDESWEKPTTGMHERAFVASMHSTSTGYVIELKIPKKLINETTALSFSIIDIDEPESRTLKTEIGTFKEWTEAYMNRVFLPAPSMERMIHAIDLPDARFSITDRHRRIVATTGTLLTTLSQDDERNLVTATLFEWILGAPIQQFDEPIRDTREFSWSAIDQALKNGEEQRLIRPSYDGLADVITIIYPIHGEEGELGVVVAEQSNLRILSQLRIALENVVGSTLLVILVASFILITIATRLTLRLHRLREETSASIDESGRIVTEKILTERHALDELGDLSRSISSMLQKLARYTHYLERMPRMLKHEILNPLNIVATSLEHLEREIPRTEKSQKYLRKSRKGIGRLGSMVQSLTEASNFDEALAPGSEEDFDLHELLDEYLDNYQNTHTLQLFQIELPDHAIPIRGWPYAIEQLLDNLLNNAVDYSDPGTPINVRVVHQKRRGIEISILNEGPPIDEGIRDTLFESMVSSRKESNPERPHLGLGLYIVRLVATHHGGGVSAKNRTDLEGSCFTVTLPLHQSDDTKLTK
jgi:two-component system, OmpR family, sensor histidine kinase ChvG